MRLLLCVCNHPLRSPQPLAAAVIPSYRAAVDSVDGLRGVPLFLSGTAGLRYRGGGSSGSKGSALQQTLCVVCVGVFSSQCLRFPTGNCQLLADVPLQGSKQEMQQSNTLPLLLLHAHAYAQISTGNDGTLITSDAAQQHPILTFKSGPVNSLRGAAALTDACNAGPGHLQQAGDSDDAAGTEGGGGGGVVVMDIGGTTTDTAAIAAGGLPLMSGSLYDACGVTTSFR